MNQKVKNRKEQLIINEFLRLLRSGKDYSTNSMYSEAGEKGFVTGPTAGNIIRKYISEQITDEMRTFVQEKNGTEFHELMSDFSERFNVCKRESRLILGYLR